MDLLDALTRSGTLAVDEASLHVVLAATHSFDKTLMATVVQDNVDPIEKLERSALILGAAVHSLPVEALVTPESLPRIKTFSPALLQGAST